MLGDISGVENIYIVCGYTDMRKAIDGLCAVVEEVVKRDPRENSLFLFCGKRCDRIKALMYGRDTSCFTSAWMRCGFSGHVMSGNLNC